jgi:hypothetical protein
MELTIFDNIIFGTLQPWQVGNQNEQTFSDLLRRAGRTVPVTLQELNNKNQILLRDYPNLYKPLAGKLDDALPVPFYKSSLPTHFNATTEFYSILMQCFALQFMYELTETINKTTDQTEAYYIINSTLEKIKYLAAGAAKELQRQGFDSIPNYQTANNIAADETIKRNIHFILFSLKQITTQIFFEVQKRFQPHVKAVEAEPQFYLHTLKETAPAQSILVPSISLYAWEADQLINSKEFSLDAAKKIQSELNSFPQQDAQLQNLHTALENVVFSNLFEIEVDGNNVAQFAEAIVSNNLFAEVKGDIEKTVQRHDKGYKRYEIINSALDKITIAPAANTQSALTRLHKWLLQQQTILVAMLNEKFPVDAGQSETEEVKKAPKISFGFTGKEDKLKNVLIELCNKVELLNEDKTNTTELLSLLMSKDIKPGITPIYLNCETVQFRYIVDKLKNHFSNLTPTEIEKSECFYSKKSNLIKAQNLYSNKIGAPKDQSTIGNIINQLQ